MGKWPGKWPSNTFYIFLAFTYILHTSYIVKIASNEWSKWPKMTKEWDVQPILPPQKKCNASISMSNQQTVLFLWFCLGFQNVKSSNFDFRKRFHAIPKSPNVTLSDVPRLAEDSPRIRRGAEMDTPPESHQPALKPSPGMFRLKLGRLDTWKSPFFVKIKVKVQQVPWISMKRMGSGSGFSKNIQNKSCDSGCVFKVSTSQRMQIRHLQNTGDEVLRWVGGQPKLHAAFPDFLGPRRRSETQNRNGTNLLVRNT